jgi:hypothetical protein
MHENNYDPYAFPENFRRKTFDYVKWKTQQVEIKKAHERLVKRWGKFPKKPLSVIACPFPDCEHHCIYRGAKTLDELFYSHVQKVHKVEPTKFCLDRIKSKIAEFNSLKFKHYTDPFLAISLDDVTRSNFCSDQ